jgi:hypothetical protein
VTEAENVTDRKFVTKGGGTSLKESDFPCPGQQQSYIWYTCVRLPPLRFTDYAPDKSKRQDDKTVIREQGRLLQTQPRHQRRKSI